jgi:hypothetical protein
MNPITHPIRSCAKVPSAIWLIAILWVAFHTPAIAQVSPTNFKAGAYRGTLQVTVSVPEVGETKTTVKIAGRSAGDSTLRFMATPQIAQPILASSDDFPVKLFSLDSVAAFMVLREVINVDASGATTDKLLDALTVNGGVVIAQETHTLQVGGDIATISTRVRLTRTGN